MKRIVSILLLISILTTTGSIAILPTPVEASTASVIAQAGGCVGSAALSQFLSNMIDKGMEVLQENIKKIANKYVQKLLGNLVEGFLGSSVPVSAKDQSMLSFFQNKYYRDDVIARCVARQILDNITNNTATIIKTRGRDGGPAFVTNWTNFLTKAQYRGENIFRAELSTAQLCGYLSEGIKKSFGVNPNKKTSLAGQNTRTDSLQPFSLAAKCTMPADWTPQKYQQDFAGNGGWNAFSRMLEPQNNAWGLMALSQNEIAKQRALQQSADTSQATAGRGYTGISGNGKADSCKIKGPTGECLVYKDLKTTGDYLANSTAAAIGAEYSWLTTAQGLNTVIENITQNMINRLFDQSDNTGGTIATAQDAPVPEISTPVPTSGPTSPVPTTPSGEEPTSLLADVQTERVKYGTPMAPAEIGKLLNTVAWKNKALGWALLGKSSGANCPAPNGTLVSCDFLIHQPTLFGYDVLIGQEDQAIPTWNGPEDLSESIRTGARIIVLPTQP